jgi:hypothetical protein
MAHDFSRYKMAQYLDGGRGNGQYDCWGLVREVLHEYYDVPELESFGAVRAKDKLSMSKAAQELYDLFNEVVAQEGVLACVYVGELLWHVGVVIKVDGLLKVLHAGSAFGVMMQSVSVFEKLSDGTIRYYQWRK